MDPIHVQFWTREQTVLLHRTVPCRPATITFSSERQ